jgi:hypothetical protein
MLKAVLSYNQLFQGTNDIFGNSLHSRNNESAIICSSFKIQCAPLPIWNIFCNQETWACLLMHMWENMGKYTSGRQFCSELFTYHLILRLFRKEVINPTLTKWYITTVVPQKCSYLCIYLYLPIIYLQITWHLVILHIIVLTSLQF